MSNPFKIGDKVVDPKDPRITRIVGNILGNKHVFLVEQTEDPAAPRGTWHHYSKLHPAPYGAAEGARAEFAALRERLEALLEESRCAARWTLTFNADDKLESLIEDLEYIERKVYDPE